MKPTGWFRRVVVSLDLPGISPFAVFTSGATFLTTKSANNDFAKFTVPTLKAFLKTGSRNVSGNKQEVLANATVVALICTVWQF